MVKKPDYIIKHDIAGRLRLAVPPAINNRVSLDRLKQHLEGRSGIESISTNRFSSSLIIRYEPLLIDKTSIIHLLDDFLPKPGAASRKSQSFVAPSENSVQKTLERPVKSRTVRKLWTLAGSLFVGIGILGIFLPLLPTVPLFLLAAFCYFRGSPRLYTWLVNFGALGRVVKDYREGRGLPARTKLRAITFMWVSLGISIIFLTSGILLRVVLVLVGLGVTLHILRVKTLKPEIPDPDPQQLLDKNP